MLCVLCTDASVYTVGSTQFVVGYPHVSHAGSLIYMLQNNRRVCHVLSLRVCEEFQRRGLGTLLMNELFRSFPQTTVKLRSVASAVTFYQRLGFVVVPTDDVCLILMLRKPSMS